MAGTVAVRFTGDTRDLNRALGDAEGKFSRFGKVAGAAMAGLAVAGAAIAVKVGADAVSAASDLNETVSKARTIFGDASWEMEQWANTAAKGFGQSKQQALDAAAGFGNLFVQLGVGSDQAAGMSRQMVQLASDFASFHNANPADVIEAQTAAFRGEFDALQKFVPTINAAAVEQEALAMTGKKAAKELTLQEKALATQALMMKGAGDAAGDFARTSDSLANKQRIVSAQFEDVKAKLGQALLPIMVTVAGFVTDRLIPVFEQIAYGIQGFFGAFSDGDVTSDGFVGWMEKMGIAASGLWTHVQEAWTGIKAAFSAAIEFVTGIFGIFKRDHDDASTKVGQTVSTVSGYLAQLREVFVSAFGAIQAVVGFAVAVLTDMWNRFGRGLIDNIQNAFGGILQVASGALEMLAGVFDLIKAVLTGKWGEAWEALKRIAGGAWETILGAAKIAIEAVRVVIETAMGAISGIWSAGWNALKTFVSDIWAGIKGIVGDAVQWVLNKIDSMLGPLDEVIGKVAKITGGAAGKVGGILGKIPGFDTGGVVPGPIGTPQLALVHGGETILPTHKKPADMPVAFPDPSEWAREAARAFSRELRRIERSA